MPTLAAPPAAPLALDLPPGYRPDWVLRYFARDPDGPAERVDGTTVAKALRIGGQAVVMRITLAADRAEVALDPMPDAAGREFALSIARRMLGLVHAGHGLAALAAADPEVARLVGDRHGLALPQTASVFEGIVWAIVGQQVNVRFAGTLRRTLVELAGTPHPSGMIAHPDPQAVAAVDPAELTARKFSRSKVDYILNIARAVAEGRLDLESLPSRTPAEAEAVLSGLKGIGPWTRQYLFVRACGFPDCAPIGDAGLAASLQHFFQLPARPTPAEQTALMQRFAPWRSLATAHLWAWPTKP